MYQLSAGCGGEAFLPGVFLKTLACNEGWFLAPNYCSEISIFGEGAHLGSILPGPAVKGC